MKNKKTFVIRIDLESDKGIREGVPRLLDLMKKYHIKGSFYLTMGGESSIIEIIRYRKKMRNSAERTIKLWSLKEKLRMVLFPKDFVKSNLNVLKRVIKEGHELGIHGWKHRAWTRGDDKINYEKHIKRAIQRYKEIFGILPKSFSAPGFNTNSRILKVLEKNHIKFISDFDSKVVKKYGNLKNIPITIQGENRVPIIEFLSSKNNTDLEIISYLKKEISKNKLASIYIHDLFEARFKLDVLEGIFKFLKKNKIKNKRIMDY
jgi:peptidoglycan/xylan/chitin deacetylase (PgdA/CDA1 family)